ncbi:MAG: TolC family protein [Sphingobacteriales bacterium]|nr:TolC family protein [Sphingobacteriales bacterium]
MRFIYCLLFFLFATNLYAQRANFDKIVYPLDMRAKDFKEVLVQLAWLNNPNNDNLSKSIIIERDKVKLEKQSWMNGVTTSFNLNEGNFSQQANGFFPIYNLNASITLGTILSTPTKVKIAKQNVQIAENKVNQQKLQLRAEVLRRYQTYLSSIEILKVRTQAVEDMRVMQTMVIRKFEQGLATVEEYTQALKSYNETIEGKTAAENDIAIAKISIEEMIGMTLEEIQALR